MAKFRQKYMGGKSGSFLSFNIDENNLSNEVIFTPSPLTPEETDPVFLASPAANITSTDITNWNNTISPNWNENDSTNEAYIQNRTHYMEIEDNYKWLDNEEFSFTGTTKLKTISTSDAEHFEIMTKANGFIENKLYAITLNETTYNLQCYTDNDEKGSFIGNSTLASTTTFTFSENHNTEVPFVIYILKSTSYRIAFLRDTNIILNDTTQTLTIVGPRKKYNSLDSNYLNGKLIKYGTGQGTEVFNSPTNIASATYSHAEGNNTTASGAYSHAEGLSTIASNISTHAEGFNTTASGHYSHAEGHYSTASNYFSHAEGFNTTASGAGSHAEGVFGAATNEGSHTEGGHNRFSNVPVSKEADSLDFVITDYSNCNISDSSLLTNNNLSVQYNTNSITSIWPITNITTTTTNNMTYLTGFTVKHWLSTNAFTGNVTIYIGNIASGAASHAEGRGSIASGSASHTEGAGTIAASSYQHVQGKFNIKDTENIYADIVGNGTDTARSNAYTLDWNGNGVYAGKLTVGTSPTENMDVATKQYVDTATAGITSDLVGLTDTTIISPTEGQFLTYDSTTSKWINSTISIPNQQQINTWIQAALANYGDGDTASYGALDGNEVSY